MATFYGAGYTDKFRTVPSVAIAANKYGGRLHVCYDSFALSGDIATTEKIYMGKLPKGARVIDCIVSFSDLDASGGTIDVGYEYNATGESALVDDTDAFADAIDVTSAGTYSMSADGANMAGFGYEVLGDADIVVVTDGDTDATTGTIKVAVLYVTA